MPDPLWAPHINTEYKKPPYEVEHATTAFLGLCV